MHWHETLFLVSFFKSNCISNLPLLLDQVLSGVIFYFSLLCFFSLCSGMLRLSVVLLQMTIKVYVNVAYVFFFFLTDQIV